MKEREREKKKTFPKCHCQMLVLALERATDGHDSLPLSNGTWKHPNTDKRKKKNWKTKTKTKSKGGGGVTAFREFSSDGEKKGGEGKKETPITPPPQKNHNHEGKTTKEKKGEDFACSESPCSSVQWNAARASLVKRAREWTPAQLRGGGGWWWWRGGWLWVWCRLGGQVGEGSGQGLKGTAVCCGLVKLPFYYFFSVQTVAYIFIFVLFFPMLGTGSSAKMMSCYLKKQTKKTPATITKKKEKVKKSPLKIVTIKKEKDTEEYRSTICVGSSSISPVLARWAGTYVS